MKKQLKTVASNKQQKAAATWSEKRPDLSGVVHVTEVHVLNRNISSAVPILRCEWGTPLHTIHYTREERIDSLTVGCDPVFASMRFRCLLPTIMVTTSSSTSSHSETPTRYMDRVKFAFLQSSPTHPSPWRWWAACQETRCAIHHQVTTALAPNHTAVRLW